MYIPVAIIPTLEIGKITFVNAWNFVHPSKNAASSNSFGMLAKNPLITHMLKGIKNAEYTIINP